MYGRNPWPTWQVTTFTMYWCPESTPFCTRCRTSARPWCGIPSNLWYTTGFKITGMSPVTTAEIIRLTNFSRFHSSWQISQALTSKNFDCRMSDWIASLAAWMVWSPFVKDDFPCSNMWAMKGDWAYQLTWKSVTWASTSTITRPRRKRDFCHNPLSLAGEVGHSIELETRMVNIGQ